MHSLCRVSPWERGGRAPPVYVPWGETGQGLATCSRGQIQVQGLIRRPGVLARWLSEQSCPRQCELLTQKQFFHCSHSTSSCESPPASHPENTVEEEGSQFQPSLGNWSPWSIARTPGQGAGWIAATNCVRELAAALRASFQKPWLQRTYMCACFHFPGPRAPQGQSSGKVPGMLTFPSCSALLGQSLH